MKLRAVGLFVKNMDAMVRFYKEVVGFPIEWDGKDPSVIVEHEGLRFLLFSRKDFESITKQSYTYPPELNGTFELGFDVDTDEDVDKEFHRMVNMGATPIIEPETYPWGLRSSYIADPEGNLIEIATWK